MRLILAAIMLLCLSAALAQHHHPPEHTQLHNEFYRNLLRPDVPDARQGSCCGGFDCYPVQAEFRGGHWWALRREDKQWIEAPNERVIKNQNSPDGRAHLCATMNFTYCFIPPPSGV